MRLTFTLVFVLVFSISSFSQAGSLIPSFGSGGRTIVSLTPLVESANKVVVQADGKIIIGGIAYGSGSVTPKLMLIRFNMDGTLDAGFGATGVPGVAEINIPSEVLDMAIQPDEKILVSTRGPGLTGGTYPTVVRLNSNGALDPTFDGDGIAVLTTGINSGSANSIALQDDGKILIAGYAGSGSQSYGIYVARLQSNGSLDPSFGTNGDVRKNLSQGDEVHDVLVQPDGKILIGGTTGIFGALDFLLLRLLPDGSLDLGFGGDGIITTAVTTGSDEANTLAVQPDGRILAAGISSNYIHASVVRYLPDGSLDLSFSDDGIGPSTTLIADYRDLEIQPDGKIVLVGFSFNNSNLNSFVQRLNANGSPDTGFGNNGINIISFSDKLDLLQSLVLWGNRIYAAGVATVDNNIDYGALLAAFQNDISTFTTAPYVLNGSALPIDPLSPGNFCFQLTPSLIYQAGSVWNSNQLNLNQSFEITTKMYFGATDNGADGIAFVLQQNGTGALGTAGGGLGYADIPGPSFIIEFDTYQNTASWYPMSDPTDDHLGFMSDGSANHNPTGGTVLQAPIMLPNIENGVWNDVVFRWNAVTKTITVTLMGNTYSYTGDIVNTVFGGNSMVYFGFTAATGSPIQGITPSQQSVCIVSATANLQGRAVMEPQLITRVQPNPTSGQFELQFNSDVWGRSQILITNSSGVVVERRSVTISGTNQVMHFNLDRLQPGIYLVRVTTHKGTQTQKLVIQ